MSTSVRFVTPSRGLPPCVRTSAKASARPIDASRPVKATVPSSATLSGSAFCVSANARRMDRNRRDHADAGDVEHLAGFPSRQLLIGAERQFLQWLGKSE